MTQSQKEFEAWFSKQKDSEYCSENVKSLLAECWQASRAALVVELSHDHDFSQMINALNEAGVTYK